MMYPNLKLITFLLTVIGIVASNRVFADTPSDTLRLMSYNIRHGEGIDQHLDFTRQAKVILNQRADIVAVQEVDSATGRVQGKYVLGELAKLTQMHAIFAPAISFDGGKYGIGLLCKEQPLSSRQISLPGREEKRRLLIVEFKHYVMAVTHLSLTPEDQLASLPLILRALATEHKPVFIAGDFNAHPNDTFIKRLQSHFTLLTDSALPTYPADKPVETLDYIALSSSYSSRISLLRTTVPEEPTASDHRPVVAEVLLHDSNNYYAP